MKRLKHIRYIFLLLCIGIHVGMYAQGITATVADASEGSNCEDGAIDLQINEGFAPYNVYYVGSNGYSSYSENVSGQDGLEDRDNLASGSYSIIVEDALCGTALIDVEIECSECPILLLGINNHGHIDCEPQKGMLTVVLTGDGAEPMDILWSNGQNTQTIDNLDAGYYSVTVTDIRGCNDSHGVELRVNNPADILNDPEDFIVKDFCRNTGNYRPDGEVEFRYSFGPDHSYLWEGPEGFLSSDENIYDLESGEYCVSVTNDISGCIVAKGCAVVAEAPSFTFEVEYPSIENDCIGSIELIISDGQEPFGVFWSIFSPITNEWSNGPVHRFKIDALPDHKYQAYVFDDNSCAKSKQISIGEECVGLEPCNRKINIYYESSCDENGTKVEVFRPIGDDDLEFYWSIDGYYSASPSRYHPSTGGDFYVIIRNMDNGCEQRHNFTLDDIFFDEIGVDELKNASFCSLSDNSTCDGEFKIFGHLWHPILYHMTLNFYPYGDNRKDEIFKSWTNDLGRTFDNLCPCIFEGSYYELIVTDEYGCTQELDFRICCCSDDIIVPPNWGSGYHSCYALPISVDVEIQNIEEDHNGSISTNVEGGNNLDLSGEPQKRCEWYDPSGRLISQDCNGIFNITVPGEYSLKVETGCQTIENQYYIADCPSRRENHITPSFTIQNSCFDFSQNGTYNYDMGTGFIRCENLGPNGPYDIYWHKEPLRDFWGYPDDFVLLNVNEIDRWDLNNLKSGYYSGEIYDKYGCYMETVNLTVDQATVSVDVNYETCTRTISCPGLPSRTETGSPIFGDGISNLNCWDQILSEEFGNLGCYTACRFSDGSLEVNAEDEPFCADSEISDERNSNCDLGACTIIWKCNGDIVHQECQFLYDDDGGEVETYFNEETQKCVLSSTSPLLCLEGQTYVEFDPEYGEEWQGWGTNDLNEEYCWRYAYCGENVHIIESTEAFEFGVVEQVLCPNGTLDYNYWVMCGGEDFQWVEAECEGLWNPDDIRKRSSVRKKLLQKYFTENDIQITLFPNPFSKRLYIKVSDKGQYQLNVLDIFGKVIIETTITKDSYIDFSGKPSGTYFFTFDSRDLNFSQSKRVVYLGNN